MNSSLKEDPASLPDSSQQGFFARVYQVVAQIPHGKVVSYGQIATLLGSPRAARQVGWALSTCPEELPWQRVVKADGSITGGEWAALRHERLVGEGVSFLPNGCVDMEACRWNPGSLQLALEDSLDEALRAEIAEEIAALTADE